MGFASRKTENEVCVKKDDRGEKPGGPTKEPPDQQLSGCPAASVPHPADVGDPELNTLLVAAFRVPDAAGGSVVPGVGSAGTTAGPDPDENMLKLPARTPVGCVASPAIDDDEASGCATALAGPSGAETCAAGAGRAAAPLWFVVT
jgi:hypothetical protein